VSVAFLEQRIILLDCPDGWLFKYFLKNPTKQQRWLVSIT